MKNTKKKFKYKALSKALLKFTLIQIVLIILFIFLPIQQYVAELSTVNLIVEDTSYNLHFKNRIFSIYSDFGKYHFPSVSRWSPYFTNSELYEHIKIGDKLTITYYEHYSIFGKQKWVIDAHSDNETYRSIEDFNEGKKPTIIFVSVFFIVIEVVFIFVCIIYIKLNYNLLN